VQQTPGIIEASQQARKNAEGLVIMATFHLLLILRWNYDARDSHWQKEVRSCIRPLLNAASPQSEPRLRDAYLRTRQPYCCSLGIWLGVAEVLSLEFVEFDGDEPTHIVETSRACVMASDSGGPNTKSAL